MRLFKRDPDEQVRETLRIYRDPGEGDGLNTWRGVLSVMAFWILFGLMLLAITAVTFELYRK